MKLLHLKLRPVLLTMLALFTGLNLVFAQTEVRGTVKDASNQPLSGVSVLIKGTTKGTSTDQKGQFSIAAAGNATLVFSMVGYAPQEVSVNDQTTINLQMQPANGNLQEVVVTALGIKKEKKAVGFSVQEVKGADLVKAREPNAVNSLVGKVAGLVVTPSANLFGDPGITLRGGRPIFVIDGVPVNTDSWNLSPDDIESYTVLKGLTAAALYGDRGANGAIQITTKRGTKDKKGWTVEFNSSTQVQTGYNAIPKVQHEYGPGDGFEYEFGDGKGGGINDYDYFIWGPRFEGQPINQWNSKKDPATGDLIPLPWQARGTKNLQNFLQNGLLSTNNIAISTSNEKSDFRMSVSQLYQKGTIPNTKLGSTNFNMSGGVNVNSKLRFEANINYNKQYTPNYPDLGYGPRSLVYNILVWGGSDYDIREIRDYWQPGKEGIQQKFVEYIQYNNPWFVAYENLHGYYKDDIYGYLKMNYKFNTHLSLDVKTNVSTYNLNDHIKSPVSGTFRGNNYMVGGYQESYDYFWDNNTEALLYYNNKFGDFGVKATAGANLNTRRGTYFFGATKGLVVPGLYRLDNSKEPVLPSSSKGLFQVNSQYLMVDVDYKNMIYLSLTGRRDQNLKLPEDNNAYYYPSASLSAIVSEMVRLPKPISFLKLRGSYAQGKSASRGRNAYNETYSYDLFRTYSPYGLRWENNVGVSYSGTLIDPKIKASVTKQIEGGLDIRFLDNRIGLDVALYKRTDGPRIVNLGVSSASGVDAIQKNAYITERKGLEMTVSGTPIVSKTGIRWDVLVNFSTSHETLKEIDGVLTRDGMIKLGDRTDGYFITDFQRDADGNILVKGNNGRPAYNPYQTKMGYRDNKFVLAMSNTLRYKNASLSFQFDGRFGGLINNYLDGYLWSAGRHPESASEYRLKDWQEFKTTGSITGSVMTPGQMITGGSLQTDQDGKVISDTRTFGKNTKPVLWQTWARDYYQSGYNLMVSRTFAKLREVILSYNLPTTMFGKSNLFKSATISFVGRNLLYFTGSGTKNVDLDQFADDTRGTDFQTPSVKSFGVNLNFVF